MRRRDFVKKLLPSVAVLGMGVSKAGAQCGLIVTPDQPEGPFYPELEGADEDNDLTVIRGSQVRAKGDQIFVGGSVIDQATCRPIEGALVEIWQACESGKYNHSGDPNTAPLDPNFQYWGRAITDRDGLYMFKTIVPGAYPASRDWVRPAHIHYKISARGFHELTTQMYFEGDPYNATDRILQSMSPEEQNALIAPIQNVNGEYYAEFNIQLREVS